MSSKSRECPNVAFKSEAICAGYDEPLVRTVQVPLLGGVRDVMAATMAGVEADD